MVILRQALLAYDVGKDEKERSEALSTVRNYCYWKHDHQRPNNLKRIKNSEEAKGGDTSEEEDEALRGFKTEYNSENTFTRERMVESLMSGNYQANIHPVSNHTFTLLAILPDYGLHKDEILRIIF